MKRDLGFILPMLLILTPHAYAGQPRTHDGFFMRLTGGVSLANTSIDDDTDELEFSDVGSEGQFAIGGSVGRNLALHGTLWGWSLNKAEGELNGQDFDSNVNVHFSAVGVGLTYHFTPSNIYVSGSAGLSHIEFDEVEDTDAGLALTVLLGKEWWVGNSWGLGIAGDFNFHSLPAVEIDGQWKGASFGLLFSATLN